MLLTSRFAAALLLCLSPLAAASRIDEPQADLHISQQSRSVQPGEIVRLQVESRQPLLSLDARIFERTFPLFQSGAAGSWEGLVGIDLDVRPGTYTVLLKGKAAGGSAVERSHALKVTAKSFPTRRITVDEKYVSPPPEVLARIEEESRRVREIFAAVTPERLWRGAFLAPVPGSPSSSFGKRSIVNGQVRSPHSGTDFSAGTGTPVQAPNAGRVVLAGDLYFSGNTVILDHGQGLYSYFAHLSRISVKEGESVPAGKIVGQVGATGRVTGPHLHWSVRLVRARVDPLALMHVTASSSPPGR